MSALRPGFTRLTAVLLLLAGCSKGGTLPPLACDAEGHCAEAGYVCRDGECVEGTDDPATPTGVIGPDGGTVVGPDGIRLVVPAGALTTETTLVLQRMSASAPTHGARAVSRVYRLGPGVASFAQPVTVIIPYTTGNLPPGTSAADVGVWRTTTLMGDYAMLSPGTPEIGSATGMTSALLFFAAAVPPEAGPQDDGAPPGDPEGGDLDAPPGDLGLEPGDSAPPGDISEAGDQNYPTNGDQGPPWGRDCSLDAALCSAAEPTCHALPGGSASVCTGTCGFVSDCPLSACCWDTQSDDNPETTLCVPAGDCGPNDPGIPQHRTCSFDPDCPRGGVCAGGSCYRAGSAGTGLAGDACAAMTDCDLLVTDGCVHRFDDGGDPAQDLWRVGDAADAALPALSVCARHCAADGSCGGGECCRLAVTQFGRAPEAFCVEDTADNCGSLTARYGTCDPFNPSGCDPATNDNCIFFETAVLERRACSPSCEVATEEQDCGTGNRCCPIETYVGNPTYCVQGATCPF